MARPGDLQAATVGAAEGTYGAGSESCVEVGALRDSGGTLEGPWKGAQQDRNQPTCTLIIKQFWVQTKMNDKQHLWFFKLVFCLYKNLIRQRLH